jgi:predicted secreted acid phosphatase
LRAYVDSSRYLRDIASVAAKAKTWLEERSGRRAQTERLAVVFDLDETLLLNWTYLSKNDFGYISAEWVRWVEEAKAPAIEPVRGVYEAARRLGLDVIFITGRTENFRGATERNLRAIGCGEYVALICQPEGTKGTSAAFKTAARERMVKEGWTIVANLGDQQSDLAGGFSERTFKLPNPFYLTE